MKVIDGHVAHPDATSDALAEELEEPVEISPGVAGEGAKGDILQDFPVKVNVLQVETVPEPLVVDPEIIGREADMVAVFLAMFVVGRGHAGPHRVSDGLVVEGVVEEDGVGEEAVVHQAVRVLKHVEWDRGRLRHVEFGGRARFPGLAVIDLFR